MLFLSGSLSEPSLVHAQIWLVHLGLFSFQLWFILHHSEGGLSEMLLFLLPHIQSTIFIGFLLPGTSSLNLYAWCMAFSIIPNLTTFYLANLFLKTHQSPLWLIHARYFSRSLNSQIQLTSSHIFQIYHGLCPVPSPACLSE